MYRADVTYSFNQPSKLLWMTFTESDHSFVLKSSSYACICTCSFLHKSNCLVHKKLTEFRHQQYLI